MSMTAGAAKALREPFPANAIGKLPKPYKADSQRGNCPDCGGYHGLPAVHLDYVGHAATTDRLLAVDPTWSWEPFSVDESGLPALDRKGNLWIRLTVCGVTRIGVGDGKSAKECIGDAIRNAAMRFGVALDLWAKEDLHDIAREQPEPERKAERVTEPQDDHWTVEAGAEKPVLPMAAKTRGRMFALFGEHHITDEDEQRRGMSHIIGREVTSRGEVTEGEAQAVIAVLAARPKPAPAASGDVSE